MYRKRSRVEGGGLFGDCVEGASWVGRVQESLRVPVQVLTGMSGSEGVPPTGGATTGSSSAGAGGSQASPLSSYGLPFGGRSPQGGVSYPSSGYLPSELQLKQWSQQLSSAGASSPADPVGYSHGQHGYPTPFSSPDPFSGECV